MCWCVYKPAYLYYALICTLGYLDPTGSNATRAECSRIKATNPQLLIKNKGLIVYPGHPNWFISCNHEEGTTAPCMMCAQGTVFSDLCGHCTHTVNVTGKFVLLFWYEQRN